MAPSHKTGQADLPLHGGLVPRWLADRMRDLGGAVVKILVEEFGPEGVLERLADPFWFQSLGAVMGMDWHSSGITTSVLYALKRAINPMSNELGLCVLGGRGKYSLQTPSELISLSDSWGLPGDSLARSSRLVAKVDSSCVQDGHELYLHNFIVAKSGVWTVIQQGMNAAKKTARRYHWHSAKLKSFTEEPHSAIEGKPEGAIINWVDSRALPAQEAATEFLRQSPQKQWDEIRRLVMPSHHNVTRNDVDATRLGAVLTLAHERSVTTFEEAILIPGLGARTLQSLALVAEMIYGRPTRFSDPARFSFALGGKDGHPFPVLTKVYDEVLRFLGGAIQRSPLGNDEKRKALARLHRQVLQIEETLDPKADVEATIAKERREAWKYGGRTVNSVSRPPASNQLELF